MSVWVTLLETAVHVPSPHNVQPWRVRIHNDQEADLLIDSARTLPKEDPTGSFIILTMGMFIEALSLLAANQNQKLGYELFHEPAWYAQAILGTRTRAFFRLHGFVWPQLLSRKHHNVIPRFFFSGVHHAFPFCRSLYLTKRCKP